MAAGSSARTSPESTLPSSRQEFPRRRAVTACSHLEPAPGQQRSATIRAHSSLGHTSAAGSVFLFRTADIPSPGHNGLRCSRHPVAHRSQRSIQRDAESASRYLHAAQHRCFALAALENRESARNHEDIRPVSEECGTGFNREEACRFHYAGPWFSPVRSVEAPCQGSEEAPGASARRRATMAPRRAPGPGHSARCCRERSRAPCGPPDVVVSSEKEHADPLASVCRGHLEKDVSRDPPGSRSLSQGQLAHGRASVSSMGFGGGS